MTIALAARAGRPATYEVQAAAITVGLQFATSPRGITYRIDHLIAEFGSGVHYARVRKLDGVYAGNDVYMRLRATGQNAVQS